MRALNKGEFKVPHLRVMSHVQHLNRTGARPWNWWRVWYCCLPFVSSKEVHHDFLKNSWSTISHSYEGTVVTCRGFLNPRPKMTLKIPLPHGEKGQILIAIDHTLLYELLSQLCLTHLNLDGYIHPLISIIAS